MTPLSLAAAHVATTPRDADHSLADTFARELLETQARLERALLDVRRLSHAPEPSPQKVWPVAVHCDGKRCSAVIAFDPAPEESRMVATLQAAGWRTEGECYWCPGCGR